MSPIRVVDLYDIHAGLVIVQKYRLTAEEPQLIYQKRDRASVRERKRQLVSLVTSTLATMDKTKLVSNDLELPPLRSLDDFLLESARFQIPNVKDLEKWGNRVVNNLLYYQTNYLFMSVVIFLIVG